MTLSTKFGPRILLLASMISILLSGAALAAPAGPCRGEWEHARELIVRIEDEWPLRGRSDTVTRYVQSVGDGLAHGSGECRNFSWHYNVVRDRSCNAFAIGGGHIYVTEGAVLLSRNESQLAAILAHEMGHQLAGHFCGPEYSAPSRRGSFDFFPWQVNSQYQDRHRVGIGSLTQVIDPAKEREADSYAVNLLLAAGFNPRALIDIAERLPMDGSHHVVAGRIDALKALLIAVPQRSAPESQAFGEVKDVLERETAARSEHARPQPARR